MRIVFLGVVVFALSSRLSIATPATQEAQKNINLSVGSAGGSLVLGPNFHVQWPMDVEGFPFLLGAQAGVFYSTFSSHGYGLEATQSFWAFPVLATAQYRLGKISEALRPYLELALGLEFDQVSGDQVGVGVLEPVSLTKLRPTFFGKIGSPITPNQKFFVEIPVGMLMNQFTILVSVGYYLDQHEPSPVF